MGQVGESPSVGKRIVWGLICCLLGIGLGFTMPLLIGRIPIVFQPRGGAQGDWTAINVVLCSITAASIVGGLTGAITGARSPQLQSIMKTLIALTAVDIATMAWCLQVTYLLPLFAVSASIKGLMVLGLNMLMQ